MKITHTTQSVRKAFRTLFLAGVFLSLFGCVLPPFQKDPPLPSGMEKLKSGDIFLGLSSSPISLFFATGGDVRLLKQADGVVFSHAMVLLPPDQEHKKWNLVGMGRGRIRTIPLNLSFPASRFIVFYRLKTPANAGAQIALQTKLLLKDPQVQEAEFDYKIRDIPGQRDQFFCLGFVNEIYRSAGFSVPFLPPKQPRCSAMITQAADLLNTDMQHALVAVEIKNNPHYEQVFFWKNPHFSEDLYWLDIHIFQIIDRFMNEGWHLQPKGTLLLVRTAHLLGILPANAIEIKKFEASLSRFYEKIHLAWSRLKKQGRTDELSETEKIKLLERICLKYRDEFFQKVPLKPDPEAK